MSKNKKANPASHAETEIISRQTEDAVTEGLTAPTVDEQLTAQRVDLDKALDTIAFLVGANTSLRNEYETTKGHVRRIGECPGLKLF